MIRRAPLVALAATVLPLALPAPAAAQALDPELMEAFPWREIGPAVFGGRIVDVALDPDDPCFLLVASASGGLWRTRNQGVTWECIFQDERTISIGDIALDPTDETVIWVGTGEGNNQRSSYWGDGVYKTTDGGETWTNTGLTDSHHIGRIVIDPTDADTVYVAALGHLYTPNAERGLYKTTDGGETWERVLFVSEDVGVVDVLLDPSDPSTVYAASYERRRRAWHFDGAGPGSAIWKSTDGGGSWTRLGGGLPEGDIGRIGLALYPDYPRLLYATVSNQNQVEVDQDQPVSFKTRFRNGKLTVRSVQKDGGAAEAGLERGDELVRLGDVVFDNAWSGVQALGRYKEADEEVELVLLRDDVQKVLRVKVSDLLRTVPLEPRFRSVGGEIYRTTDGGATWEKRNENSVGGRPAYYYGQIRVDPEDRERLYVLGVPLVMSEDGGATWSSNIAGSVHVDHHALEIDPADSRRMVLGNDGGLHFSYDRGKTWRHVNNLPIAQFYTVGVDMSVPYRVYGGTQDNGTWGGPSRSRQSAGIGNSQWYSVGGGDGFYAVPDPRDASTVYGESQFGAVYRRDVEYWRTTSIRPRKREQDPEERYRFNWSSPILVSHHNHEIVYFGGNRLFKSFDRGDTWPVVSEDLSTADPVKIEGNVPHCTITTIAESPFAPGLVMVGTDDGLVQLSEDGCLSWTNLAGRFPGVPSNWWVSRVGLSLHDPDTAYVTFTGYREDDFRAFAYRSRDRGKTWQPISGGLPAEPVNVLREDPLRDNVLYVGTEFGAYVSVDSGESWSALGSGLPTIAVHDLIAHPRDGEVVVGTHGRGFWIVDVSVIRQMGAEVLAKDAHLFDARDVVRLQRRNLFGWSGDGGYAGANPEPGVSVAYWLKSDHKRKEVTLQILDAAGNVARELDAPAKAGLQRVSWNLRVQRPRGEEEEEGGRRRRRPAAAQPDGDYRVVLTVGEQTFESTFNVSGDPLLGGITAGPDDEVDFWPRDDR